MIGSQDLIVGLVLALVLFGAKKLPELAGSIGKSMKEFKKGVSEATEEEPVKPTASAAATATIAPAPASKACASCQTPLQADWQHCPRCGASTA